MSQIEVPDWVVEVAARIVAKNVGEDYDSLGQFTQDTIKATQRECITAALGAWVVPVGVRYRVAPNDACRARPWEGAGIVAEWNRSLPNSSETLQYQPLYVLRQEKPE